MSDMIVSIGSAVLGRLFGRRLEHRRLKSGRYRCALRILEGAQAGLDRRWSIEKALVGSRELSFRGPTAEISYISESAREPSIREQWSSLGTEFVIFRAECPKQASSWASLGGRSRKCSSA